MQNDLDFVSTEAAQKQFRAETYKGEALLI